MYFPSIRDKWLTVIIWGICLAGIILPIINGQFIATIMMLLLASFLLWFWFRTGYKIDGEKIKIYYGPIRQTIQISSGKFDIVSISPQNRNQFISMLLDIRSDIPIDKRLLPKEIE